MCEKNILQLPNEILDEIIWKILNYDENDKLSLIIWPHEQRIFYLTKYIRVCKKFQNIIQEIINRQKLQVIIIRKRKWYCTIAVELNNNRLLIELTSLLRKYIEEMEQFMKKEEEINGHTLWKLDFKPQEYLKWRNNKNWKSIKRPKILCKWKTILLMKRIYEYHQKRKINEELIFK